MKTHLDEQPLPQGWNLCCSTTSVVFSKLQINTDLLVASATLLVKVDESLHWSITCNGVDVSECTVLDSVPSQLNEVSEMMQLLTCLQDVMMCHGNPADDFKDLTAHKTEFMDPSGMTTCLSY